MNSSTKENIFVTTFVVALIFAIIMGIIGIIYFVHYLGLVDDTPEPVKQKLENCYCTCECPPIQVEKE